MIEKYVDARSNANDWTDTFIAKASIQEELTRLFKPLNIQQPNDAGETMCIVKWVTEDIQTQLKAKYDF